MKAKNALIILVLNMVILTVASIGIELVQLNYKALHIQTLMQTAGDMALEETQVSDEFWSNASGYLNNNAGKYNIKVNKGNSYAEMGVYEGLYNLSSSGLSSTFRKLYDNTEFRSLANKTGNSRMAVQYFNSSKTRMNWYYIPRVAQVGSEILGGGRYSTCVYTDQTGMSTVNGTVKEGIYNDYSLRPIQKSTQSGSYFITPISAGITYLDRNSLAMLYMNNLDLLMRSKYVTEGKNLSTSEGGNGILKSGNYQYAMKNASGTYINDGVFSLNMGSKASGTSPSVNLYYGVKPDITYKMIDMFDSRNDKVLTELFGANTTYKGINYYSKARYLKAIDATKNPVTNSSYQKKVISVAMVTFHAKVVVPYSTTIIRGFRALDDVSNNYEDLKLSGKDIVLNYTRLFAVAP